MEEKKTIILKYPIKIKADSGADIETSKLYIGRLKVKHLKLLPPGIADGETKKDIQLYIPLIAAICGITTEALDEVDAEDLKNISTEIESFFV